MLSVAGPNEYEKQCHQQLVHPLTLPLLVHALRGEAAVGAENRPKDYARICVKRRFDASAETARWMEIVGKMYLGEDFVARHLLQQDGYLDKGGW